jgi:hypothetical protein
MSCIISLVDRDSVWMAADSAVTAGGELKYRRQPKIFRRRRAGITWMLGADGLCRLSQILQFVVELPKTNAPHNRRLFAFLIRDFIPALRQAVIKSGALKIGGGSEQMDGSIMIGLNGHIFTIDPGFAVLERADDLPQSVLVGLKQERCLR